MNAVKERPILFSTPMVREILEGRKTVTRREVKKPAALDCLAAGFEPAFLTLPGNADLCPYGRPGDRLWVRETWLPDPDSDHDAWYDHTETYYSWSGCGSKIDGVPPALRTTEQCLYRSDGEYGGLIWRPSIHMPRWASRILLEITDVRVERLQDISDEQCVDEGTGLTKHAVGVKLTVPQGKSLPKAMFEDLWVSINGAESWDANPWVWVVEFTQVTKDA